MEYREITPGRLVLTLGEGYRTSTSVKYNLSRLYAAYTAALGYPDEGPVLELWEGGRKVGELTRLGLQEPAERAP